MNSLVLKEVTRVVKIALMVFADMTENHTEMARATNALQIAEELIDSGDDVSIVFDGGGVTSAVKFADPDHPMHSKFEKIEDHIAGACLACAKAFEAKEDLEKYNIPILDDYKQHPSIRNLIVEGYQIITL